jgi:hypothetical protein
MMEVLSELHRANHLHAIGNLNDILRERLHTQLVEATA